MEVNAKPVLLVKFLMLARLSVANVENLKLFLLVVAMLVWDRFLIQIKQLVYHATLQRFLSMDLAKNVLMEKFLIIARQLA